MATRGTYKILSNKTYETRKTLCFYIHWDNYPEGAAAYFKKALAVTWKNQIHGKTFQKQFFSIDGSELTAGHDYHGDTQYRYDITETDNEIIVSAFERNIKTDEWSLIFCGRMHQFIEQYGNKEES